MKPRIESVALGFLACAIAGCQWIGDIDAKSRGLEAASPGAGGASSSSSSSLSSSTGGGAAGSGGGNPCALFASQLESDPENCGDCGHSCLGGDCVQGDCQPVLFTKTGYHPNAIVLDAENVYWNEYYGYAIKTKPKYGATHVKKLAIAVLPPTAMILDGTHLLWSEYGAPSAVMGVSTHGGPRYVVKHLDYPGTLAVTFDAIFVTASDDTGDANMILRLPKDGSDPVLLRGGLDQTGSTVGIVTDGQYVYFADAADFLGRVPVNGGPVEAIDTSSTLPWGLAVDETDLYWCDQVGIYKKKKDAGPEEPAEELAQTEIPCDVLTIDDKYVYVGAPDYANSSGFVGRVPKSGVAGLDLFGKFAVPSGIAVDDVAIYWTGSYDDTIWRKAK